MDTATAPFKVKAIYEYISDHPDDLSFPVSQIITVTEEEDEEWYSGRYFDNNGVLREGMFPRNFVEIVVEDESPAIPSHPPRPHRSQAPTQTTSSPIPAAIIEAEPELEGKPDQSVSKAVVGGSPQAQSKPVPVLSSPIPAAVLPAVSTPSEPPITEEPVKPAGKSSFRDRIAAFNVATATPVAPQAKPAVSSFVKRPFVAPAPSAYIPSAPQAAPKPTGASYEQSTSPRVSIDDDRMYSEEPHTSHEPIITGGTSLKDRIALLQQMQLEQQAAQAAKMAKKKKTQKKHQSQQFTDVPEEYIAEAETAEVSGESPRNSVENRRIGEELEPLPLSEHTTQIAQPEVLAIPGVYMETEEPTPMTTKSTDIGEESAGDQSDVEDNINARSSPAIPQMHVPEAGSGPVVEADDEPTRDIEEDEVDEDEEIDPEVARRIAIRERMAKMSGGMGMPFALPGVMGMPMGTFPKSTPKKAQEPPKEETEEVYSQYRAIPILPMAVPSPANQEPRRDDNEREDLLESEQEEGSQTTQAEVEAEVLRKDALAETHPSEDSTEPEQEIEDAVVSLRLSDTAVAVPMGFPRPSYSTAAGEDDSMEQGSQEDSSEEVEEGAATSNYAVPPVPLTPQLHPPVPAVPKIIRSPPAPSSPKKSRANPPPLTTSPSASYTSVGGSEVPPVPQFPPTPSASHTSQHQLPPPPPPPAAPPASYAPPPVPNVPPVPPAHSVPVRRSTDISERSFPRNSTEYDSSDNDEATTGYEADDDTDLNVSSTHESAYAQYTNYTTTNDSASAPSIPPSVPPSHAAPPRPRSYPLPPPPPPPPTHYAPPPMSPAQYASPPPPAHVSPPVPTSPAASYTDRRPSIEGRLSMDPRRSAEVRRSLDRPRQSMDIVGGGTYMASDIDLGEKSGWWSAPESVPPSLLSRTRDLSFEVDERLHSRRGRGIITRIIYVLYYDYSQSVITVQFERENPSRVKFEQRHEPPPPPLRRDQLEDVYARFGAKIKNFAVESLGKNVGDGSPFGYVRAVVSRLPDALQSAGTRSHGAIVYSNLANASVTQVDEIKPGDIISFRNGKFQGHKGGLHQKYSLEVGKPEHCAIVQEWDGTKRKIKVLEQSKEKGRVRAESYRLGDLKSGEVMVFRVVGRDYVGWVGDEF
ncbi:uncharacterized protein V1513DRAFT_392998 [Lipomyces chichibuensis]|uniref:uncharacterized protein n=1 Tax=Lipomyces chichibuensis TaxID=1546026 RepID=UPI0033431F2A